MPIDQKALAERIRQARETMGLSQEAAARAVGIGRPALAQIELAKRGVSSLELDRLARLYGRDIRDFLAEDFTPESSFGALFRAKDIEDSFSNAFTSLRRCANLSRHIANLEQLVGRNRPGTALISFARSRPRNLQEARAQGRSVAEEERGRLGLGDAPIADLANILDVQGIRTAFVDLPDDISGLTLIEPAIGPMVVVNASHPPARRRFSLAHEYAHVLLDRDTRGSISRSSDKHDFLEVRANAFAANFLMPDDGVRRYLKALGRLIDQPIYDEAPGEEDVVRPQARSGDAKSISLHELILLASHFGVSRSTAAYRLRNLNIVSQKQLTDLLNQDKAQGVVLASLLGVRSADENTERNGFQNKVIGLAIEAYQRELITRSKLHELYRDVLGRSSDQADEDLSQLGFSPVENEHLAWTSHPVAL